MADLGAPRLRLTIVGVVVLSLFAALLTRLWYLQVLDSPRFVAEAKRNEVKIVCEPAPRGLVRDRAGKVLVGNRVTTALTLSRMDAKDHPGTLPRVAALLGGVTVGELQKRLDDPRYSQVKPVPIAFDVPDEKVIFIKESSTDFPGVDAAPLATRTYPFDRLASHVLGTVGPITRAELDASAKSDPASGSSLDPLAECDRYGQNDEIGKTGIEFSFDSVLRGQARVVAYEVDRNGKVLNITRLREARQGADVVLTLDADLQAQAEESLKQGLAKAKELRNSNTDPSFLRAPGGSAVVVDTTNGAVLAMASFPDFAPADFVGGISKQGYQAYKDNPATPLANRAIQGLYPPASTFKLPTSVAGLVKGIIPSPNSPYADNGSFTIPGQCSGRCTFYNAGRTGHGNVNLQTAITVSSDTYFYNVGAKFWIQRRDVGSETALQDTARAFGLGSRTGVSLPSEAEGRVSDPNVREKLHKARPADFPDSQWRTGDSVITAIGQGETAVTPLQLAMEYATFANGGTLYQARIADKVVNPDGSTGRDLAPVTRGTVDLPPPVRDPILNGLRGATTSPYGTAGQAFSGYSGLPVAGKTGTAQVAKKQDTAIFCSFGPVTDPRYAISVVLEESGFGGTTAAPVARRIWDFLSGRPTGEVRAVSSSD